MTIPTHILQADTQAVLLLCSAFGQSRKIEPMPLSLGEYNRLAECLQSNSLRPADLLTPDRQEWLHNNLSHGLDVERINQLLQRGAMLAFKVEEWTAKGLWILSRSDTAYPSRLKRKLKRLAPPILYGAGNQDLLHTGGLAIVGSRNIDHDGLEYTQQVAEKCAEQQIQIVSGGARGVDQQAMLGAITGGGTCIGVLADRLIKATVSTKYRDGIRQGQVALISPYDPSAGFNAGNAMNRNKHIYALAEHALVVDTSYKKGGTWAGATEELKRDNSISVWVRLQDNKSEGNEQLQKLGAKPFPFSPWNRNVFLLLSEAERFLIEKAENVDGKYRSNIEPVSVEADIDDNLTTQIEISSTIPAETDKAQRTVEEQISIETKPISSSLSVDQVQLAYQGRVPKDAYDCILPFLLSHLNESKNEREIAKLLDAKLGQTRAWLQRAIEEELVSKQKEKKQLVYVLSQKSKQLQLLNVG